MKKAIISIICGIILILILMFIADQATFSIAVKGINIVDLFSLAIFLFIVYFFVTKKSWPPKKKKTIITIIIIYCCFNVYLVTTNFGISCIKKVRPMAKLKSCWSDIRTIEFAIEDYNIDHKIMMKTSLDFPLLIKEGYLKAIPKGSEEDCRYYIFGDISKTDNGFVYCINHLRPDTNPNIIESFSSNSYYTTEKIPQSLINEIIKHKTEVHKEIEAKRTTKDRLLIFLKDNLPIIKAIFIPIQVLFFPFSLHPLR